MIKTPTKNKKSANSHFLLRPRPEQSPPYFSFGETSVNDFTALTNNGNLGQKELSVLTAIFELCGLVQSNLIDSTELCEHLCKTEEAEINGKKKSTLSSSALRKRLQPLCDIGVITKKSIPKDKGQRGRAPTLYEITLKNNSLKELAERKTEVAYLPMLSAEDQREIDVAKNQTVRIDDFWCQLIASVLPINDRSQAQEIKTVLTFKRTKIPITVTSQVNSRIPTIRSIKTIIAVLTIAEIIIKDRARNRQSLSERFVINISEILKVMRSPNEGGFRQSVLNHLVEWNGTIFNFGDIPAEELQEINEKFDTAGFGFSRHQLIQQLSGVGTLKGNQKIPTTISFELPNDLVKRIAEEGVYNLFTVTPLIMAESRPLAIALHLYCRKKIGQNTKFLTPNVETLRVEIAPAMTKKKFASSFKQLLLEKQTPMQKRIYAESSEPAIERVNVLGYLVTLNNKRLTITTDPDDKYVGSMTRHRYLLQQKERELSSSTTKKHIEKSKKRMLIKRNP